MKLSLFQTILLGTFGMSALIGLFVFATYTSSGGGGGVGAVVIWGTLPQKDIQNTIAEASKVDAAFKNVSYIEKSPTTLASDIAISIATDSSPDLILASQEELYGLTKFIQPIPNTSLPVNTFTNTFVKEGEVFTAPGGAGYFGLPFLVNPLVLFSNRAILSNSGIPKPPATWEGLIGLVPNIAVLTPTRQITRGLVGLGTYSNVRNARGILSALFLQQGIPMTAYSTSGNLGASLGSDKKSGVDGTSVLGFYTQFADPSKISYTWNSSLPDSEQMFISGDLALYIGYASRAHFLRAANPNLDFIISSLPQSGVAKAKRTYGLLYAFMISRGAKNASGAYQIATLLANPALQVAAATATGLAPTNISALENVPSSDPVAAVSYAGALYSEGWLSPAATDVDRVFSAMISDVMSGRSELGTALSDAESSLTSLY